MSACRGICRKVSYFYLWGLLRFFLLASEGFFGMGVTRRETCQKTRVVFGCFLTIKGFDLGETRNLFRFWQEDRLVVVKIVGSEYFRRLMKNWQSKWSYDSSMDTRWFNFGIRVDVSAKTENPWLLTPLCSRRTNFTIYYQTVDYDKCTLEILCSKFCSTPSGAYTWVL